jgi:hypothetical protein
VKKMKMAREEETAGPNIEDKVDYFSRAAATVLLPLIDSLGDLEVEEYVTGLQGYARGRLGHKNSGGLHNKALFAFVKFGAGLT